MDQYAGYVAAAFGITAGAFTAYLAYLRSRLSGLTRALDESDSAATTRSSRAAP